MVRKILLGLFVVVVLAVGALGVGYALLHRADIPYAELDKAYGYPAEETRFVDLGDGLAAHVRITGNRAGKTLLLIHGYTASAHTWDPLVDRLKAEHRLVVIDLPGHGLTRTPPGYQASIEGFADFVEKVCERLGLPKMIVVGSSMGGNTAWQLALRTPGRVDGLVLVAAAGWPRSDGADATETPITRLMRNPTLGPILRDLDATAIFTQGLKASFVNEALATPEMVKRYVDLTRAPGHRPVILDLRLNYTQRTPASDAVLAKIQAPTLILHGEKDALVPFEGGQKFDGAIPNSRLIPYPNVGHMPQEEIPDQVAADLKAFIALVYPEPAAGAPLVLAPAKR
jgi:pimeloyl-ACP methyl ester carboxylesterase